MAGGDDTIARFFYSRPEWPSPGILRLYITQVMVEPVCRLLHAQEQRWRRRQRRRSLANFGTSMGRERFNAVESFPDQPDKLELWPKGVLPPTAGGGGFRSEW